MKFNKFARPALVLVVLFTLFGNLSVDTSLAQSRRLPPPSGNEKKNKRPAEGQQPGENPQEPLPPDLTGKPQEAEKITVTTQIVNVDAVVYNKKTGQIINGLKKENFTVFSDGAPETITNFSTPEAP